MRRRFGGRRRRDEPGRRPQLDVRRELERVAEARWVPPRELTPVAEEEVPPSLAAVGIGEDETGRAHVVGVAPQSGGDAWIAAVSVAARRLAQGLEGDVWAVSSQWPAAARRRLALEPAEGLRVRAVHAPPEGRGGEPGRVEVAAERPELALGLSEAQLKAQLARVEERELLGRALGALGGLAHKHGGRLHLTRDGAELVFFARPVAWLRVEGAGSGLALEVQLPRRQRIGLDAGGVADAFDQLEGLIRKHLNDKKIRDSEEGLRARLLGLLARLAGNGSMLLWPLPGTDPDPLDFVAVDGDGNPVVGAVRRELDLESLGPILDGLLTVEALLPLLIQSVPGRLRFARPRIVLAAERFDAGAESVFGVLDLESRLFDIEARRGEPVLVTREPISLARPTEPGREPTRTTVPPSPPPEREKVPASDAEEASGVREASFEEFSALELDDEERTAPSAGERESGRRRRRRRGRGRGRGRGRSEEGRAAAPSRDEGASDAPGPERAEARAPQEEPAARTPESRRLGRPRKEDEDDEETLTPLSPEAPEFIEEPEPAYDDEDSEEEGETEADPRLERLRREREARRRARLAKLEAEAAEEPVKRPRRRAAFVALADRDAVGAAVLLARDLRLVEGIWVYPQSELMTFFRSVATDLHEETPIYLLGFTASPARETLQAAALYRDRLTWFDHHAWPPEDLEGLRAAIGAGSVHVDARLESSLPIVLSHCTRRSRFSDKLVDLLRGRFSQHDYERWGRLWWWRLGEIAAQPGERRGDLAALLAGRPSELAREAARAAAPPPPLELEYVASRDFRLVHFGGYGMVLVPVEEPLDLHLTARIARERYGTALSLASRPGDERLFLAADDVPGRPALDLGAMVDHLAGKFEWVEALSDADHVARFRVAELATRPERMEEIVAEIAMGRSVLEG